MLGLLNISEGMSIALHICVRMASEPKQYFSARALAKEMGFSVHHSAKIVQQLVHAGLLETERGPFGGARLTQPASRISLLAIYIAAGGTPTYTGCLLKHTICDGTGCALGKLMAKENQRLVDLLKGVSLASVVRSFQKHATKNPRKRTQHET